MNILKRFLTYVFFFVLVTGCTDTGFNAENSDELISYLEINVDEAGRLPSNPYIVDLRLDHKHLIVLGTLHSRDTADKMFADIEKIFLNLDPEVAINEGGYVSSAYDSRNIAIMRNGELGLLKFLSDIHRIEMINGDIQDDQEFYELAEYYSKDKALFFFATERFILPYTRWNEAGDLDSLYTSDFIEAYLIPSNIELTEEEKQFSYYKSLYKKFYNKEFSIDSISSDDFSPIRETHYFCEVARKSKELRDKVLLNKIEAQLEIHDKVIVVFGGWHVLAIEPALTEILNRVNQ